MAKKKEIKFLKLDLGCGQNKTEGFIGVDKHKLKGVDVVHDLTKFPYPFKNESVEEIVSNHFVEHLDGFERIKFFDECYRILIPNGKMRLTHPYYKSSRAVQDPTHKFPPICEESYYYLDKNIREQWKIDHYAGACDFEFNIAITFMDNSWLQKSEEVRNFAMKHYFNVIADMIVDLKKK